MPAPRTEYGIATRMATTFANPPERDIRALLERVRTIAVVGLSPKPGRPSHRVAAGLQTLGYRIIPVRPAVDSVLGEPSYPDLDTACQAVGNIDLVDVFRAPDQIVPVIDACLRLHLPALWLQDGVINPAEALRARDAGMTVVMDRCTWRDANQLHPSLTHLK